MSRKLSLEEAAKIVSRWRREEPYNHQYEVLEAIVEALKQK